MSVFTNTSTILLSSLLLSSSVISSSRSVSISTPLIFHNRVTQNFIMHEVSRHNSPDSSNIRATYPFRMPFFHCSHNYSTCPCSTSLCSTCHKNPVSMGWKSSNQTMRIGFNKNFGSIFSHNLDAESLVEHIIQQQYSEV